MKQVIVTGGRDYDDWAMIQEVLEFIKPDMVIQGGASGADRMAREWAEYNSVACVTMEAEWSKYGKSAGPMRNRMMIDKYPEAVIVAFPGGKGTADCVAAAYARNRIILQVHK